MSFPKNCLAYDDKLSIYLLCPSANKVLNANDDFPDPETPDITVILFFGISNDIFFKLCNLAPVIMIFSLVFEAIFFIFYLENLQN